MRDNLGEKKKSQEYFMDKYFLPASLDAADKSVLIVRDTNNNDRKDDNEKIIFVDDSGHRSRYEAADHGILRQLGVSSFASIQSLSAAAFYLMHVKRGLSNYESKQLGPAIASFELALANDDENKFPVKRALEFYLVESYFKLSLQNNDKTLFQKAEDLFVKLDTSNPLHKSLSDLSIHVRYALLPSEIRTAWESGEQEYLQQNFTSAAENFEIVISGLKQLGEVVDPHLYLHLAHCYVKLAAAGVASIDARTTPNSNFVKFDYYGPDKRSLWTKAFDKGDWLWISNMLFYEPYPEQKFLEEAYKNWREYLNNDISDSQLEADTVLIREVLTDYYVTVLKALHFEEMKAAIDTSTITPKKELYGESIVDVVRKCYASHHLLNNLGYYQVLKETILQLQQIALELEQADSYNLLDVTEPVIAEALKVPPAVWAKSEVAQQEFNTDPKKPLASWRWK